MSSLSSIHTGKVPPHLCDFPWQEAVVYGPKHCFTSPSYRGDWSVFNSLCSPPSPTRGQSDVVHWTVRKSLAMFSLTSDMFPLPFTFLGLDFYDSHVTKRHVTADSVSILRFVVKILRNNKVILNRIFTLLFSSYFCSRYLPPPPHSPTNLSPPSTAHA